VSVPPRFLHVAFNWQGAPKETELRPLFDTALDWAHYAPNCWILWSTTEIETWVSYLKKHMGPSDSVVICEVNLSTANKTYSGLADKWVWTWVQKKR
jgi:hypothetical protein